MPPMVPMQFSVEEQIRSRPNSQPCAVRACATVSMKVRAYPLSALRAQFRRAPFVSASSATVPALDFKGLVRTRGTGSCKLMMRQQ